MTDKIKSILSGLAATPIVLIMTIGLAEASGLNPHFLLVSVIITNIIGIIINRKSSNFYNLEIGIITLFYSFHETIGIESGSFHSFIIFAVPAVIFSILSFLPIKYIPIPKRLIAILAFGFSVLIIFKQLPIAFEYTSPEGEFQFIEEGQSNFPNSSPRNWIQLVLALSISIIALLGRRFNKGVIALILATCTAVGIGYVLDYNTDPLYVEMLQFNQSFQLDWTFNSETIMASLELAFYLSIIMLMSFWMNFAILNKEQKNYQGAIKKSLRTVGLGNLFSGLFGLMPSNISLKDSLSIKAYGGSAWLGKLPILLVLLLIGLWGIPNLNIPLFAFAGVFIYIGILLFLQSWQLLKELHWLDYLFAIIIGIAFLSIGYIYSFQLALIYAFVFHFITRNKQNESGSVGS